MVFEEPQSEDMMNDGTQGESARKKAKMMLILYRKPLALYNGLVETIVVPS